MTTSLWSLAQVAGATDAPRSVVRRKDDGALLALPPELDGLSTLDILRRWDELSSALRDLDLETLSPLPAARAIAPLTYPNKVLCAGANYSSHCKEMGVEEPDPTAPPFFFLKPPTTTLVGDDVDVAIAGDKVDWEVELAVVVGRHLKDAGREQAREAIAGYAVANDISDRAAFVRTDGVGPAFGFDWLAHKGQDGFCPLGPGITPFWFVDDPQDLGMRLTVNDQVRQESTTAEMVVPVLDLLVGASRMVTLEPGDIVLTGTPAGVGAGSGTFLSPGDVVTAAIHSLGSITTRITGTLEAQR